MINRDCRRISTSPAPFNLSRLRFPGRVDGKFASRSTKNTKIHGREYRIKSSARYQSGDASVKFNTVGGYRFIPGVAVPARQSGRNSRNRIGYNTRETRNKPAISVKSDINRLSRYRSGVRTARNNDIRKPRPIGMHRGEIGNLSQYLSGSSRSPPCRTPAHRATSSLPFPRRLLPLIYSSYDSRFDAELSRAVARSPLLKWIAPGLSVRCRNTEIELAQVDNAFNVLSRHPPPNCRARFHPSRSSYH